MKAFDKLWREGLFFKMKKQNYDTSLIILLNIYYDHLASYIKLEKDFSKKIKLKRGVKQGGVLSNFII